jgi:chromosome segregation ATPase
LGASGLAVLGLLAQSSSGQDPGREEHDAAIKARLDQRKAFAERMRNAGSAEERIRMMEEIRAMDRQRAIEEFKCKLKLSDQEWSVLRPRIETVYNLVHPPLAMKGGADRKGSELEHRRAELREVLDKSGAEANEIKSKMTALRMARDKADQELAKARQELRQLMTVRQEAELILSDLLD